MPHPRPIQVWDLPIRLFHWTLACLFAGSWVSGNLGKLDIHMKLGAAILSLLLFRLAWGVWGSATARFSHFVVGPGRIKAYLRGQWSGLGHNPLGALSVLAMLGLLLLQTVSGMVTTDDIASDGPLVWLVASKTVKLASTLHRLEAWALLGLVALHLGSIAFYRLKGQNLVRPMIIGCKTLAEEIPEPPRASPWTALGLQTVAALVVFGGLAIWGK